MRSSKSASLFIGLGIAAALVGCPAALPPLPPDVGGLEAEDFEPISLNGFDPEDNRVDLNDYAWAMEYFEPDGDAPAYVYVGTGNDMIGLIYQGIASVLGPAELGDIETKPPEIRRYRGDVFPYAWERVLDYHDVDQDPDPLTMGFRFLRQYRSPGDGVNRLYAGTFGRQATVWRSQTGDPDSWEIFWQTEEPGSIRHIEEHNGLLYLAFANEAPTADNIVGKIFATDGKDVYNVTTNGFGDPENVGVMCLASFNGWLYAGTKNEARGYQVWKLAGPDGDETPVMVVANGGPSPSNESAITPCVFADQLYIGSALNPLKNITEGFKAADIIRISTDDTWETVVGPDSISGFDSGFDHWPNTYIWSMTVHHGWLYTATYDQISPFFNVLENMDRVLAALTRARQANLIERVYRAGSDLYKTQDGILWYRVTLDGFGDVGNYGFRVMESVGDDLYVGTANPFDGLEVWRGHSSDD
jgi:hypothetical protein